MGMGLRYIEMILLDSICVQAGAVKVKGTSLKAQILPKLWKVQKCSKRIHVAYQGIHNVSADHETSNTVCMQTADQTALYDPSTRPKTKSARRS